MRPVRLSRLAAAEIAKIGREIAVDRPRAAEAFVDQVIQRCLSVADAPQGYSARPEFGPGVRGVPVQPYIILYRVRERDILILSARHGARKPVTLK